MTDFLSEETRSKVMAAVRSSRNESTELTLIRIFRKSGISGWRRNRPVFGKPDFVFPKRKVAVFVDGCFWHGCPWHCRMPKSRLKYWNPKIERNRLRDKLVMKTLRSHGWYAIRIWEHSLKDPLPILEKLKSLTE